ncbi:MAG: lyso-ornithine lipid O-acyltransferase [Sphingomonadales bacterium]|jgi:1-acyl-sn-glycerol-3-phosphate acyltransferase|nr:lyso-ornithine lipid O-acyltransferase [Sphingomonadales bacterium]MEA3035816.1 lyso-ornithine lipid O-acyltransferase [Sphingomonadales bacterium]
MVRFVYRSLLILLGLFVCVPLHYASLLVLRRSRWPRRFLWWAGYASGMRVRVEGAPLARNVLFLANHLSWLDILVLAGASGTAFVAKDDVARWPVIGWLARLNDTVFIARTSRAGVKGQADALRTALASGLPVALFPEGTTEGGIDILPFRASLLASLFPPLERVKAQPVAIDYGVAAHEIAWIGDETAPANARRVLSRRGTAEVMLRFLAPVDPASVHDRKHLAEAARAEIVEALSVGAPPPGASPSGAGADRL